MATNRRRRTRNKLADLIPRLRDWLFDRRAIGPLLDCERSDELWEDHKAAVLAYWLQHHPCTRPRLWWEFDAPKELIEREDSGPLCIPLRRRLGGAGKIDCSKVFTYHHSFIIGLPKYFTGIDPDNMPVYESQAAYLKRHNLLDEDEAAYLADHPELLEPEVLRVWEEYAGCRVWKTLIPWKVEALDVVA